MTTENLGNLNVLINGRDFDEYELVNFDLFNIPYDGAVSVYFITKINFDLTAELLDNKSPYKIIIHNTGETILTRNVDSFIFQVPSDGYYEVISLTFPTTTYIEDGLGYSIGSRVTQDLDKNIIAANIDECNKISFKILTHSLDKETGYYEHIWSGWKDISLDEILILLEQEEKLDNVNEVTVRKDSQSVFVIDNLYRCYINKANDLLNIYSGDSNFCASNSLCRDSLNKYKSEIQIRDYLWMAINVIKYCIQNCQYLKALKVLNCVTTCAGVCSEDAVSSKTLKGCGCNK